MNKPGQGRKPKAGEKRSERLTSITPSEKKLLVDVLELTRSWGIEQIRARLEQYPSL